MALGITCIYLPCPMHISVHTGQIDYINYSHLSDTCLMFNNIALNARATSEPLCCVVADIVPNAAVKSFTSTPKEAAVEATIVIPSDS